ncbi:MAG TPA: hypothetical protein VG323_15205 [Thermoanaerobaculia bacterium]|nr:hypothetical protein [Thermoanaerobaculia bacterium]
MKRRWLVLILLLAAIPFTVEAQDCSGKPRFSINAVTGKSAVAFPGDVPASLHEGDKMTLAIGGQTYPATVHLTEVFGVKIAELTTDPINNGVSSGFSSGDITLKPASGNVIELCPLTPLNYSMHAGPTITPANDNAAGDPTGVMRFQYQKGLVRSIEVNHDPTLIPAMRNVREELSISIDTTDRQTTTDKKFVDDNRIAGAIHSPEYTFGPAMTNGLPFFNRVRAGIEGQIARAMHSENRNRDFTIVVDGWLPFLQSINLLSAGRTVTLPLAFHLSAGHRHQDVDGNESGGRVADASLIYHFYVFDHYAVDLTAKTLLNDVSDRPASTPRTQHSYKAQVSYKQDALSKFSVVASFENGHSGPVFTKLKQFFLGVGAQQLLGIPAGK